MCVNITYHHVKSLHVILFLMGFKSLIFIVIGLQMYKIVEFLLFGRQMT
jgi:hypothetical protein